MKKVLFILLSVGVGFLILFTLTAVLRQNSVGTILAEDGSAPYAIINTGTSGGTSSKPVDINNAVQNVGSSTISGEEVWTAFPWQEGSMIPLTVTGSLTILASLWEKGVMQDLDVLGEVFTAISKANAVNNLGMVVGQAQLGSEDHAVLWKEGQNIELNGLLPPGSDWDVLLTAESIHDNGWIAGTGLKGGHEQTNILQPLQPIIKNFFPIVAKLGLMPPRGEDMTEYMIGDGRLYEVRHSSDSQSRHQTQLDDADNMRFFHTKGYKPLPTDQMLAEWEELWAANSLIYRGTDTSPGNDQYYTLYEGNKAGSPWIPRYWKVGDIYEREPYVVFYNKSDCSIAASGFNHNTWLRFEAVYDSYTFESGITLKNVIKLAWLLDPDGQPIEYYFYAKNYGLVGWDSNDRGYSYISEIFDPIDRNDNVREIIPCLGGLDQGLVYSSALNFGPLPEPYASRVK